LIEKKDLKKIYILKIEISKTMKFRKKKKFKKDKEILINQFIKIS
jgi:hypothetical protein